MTATYFRQGHGRSRRAQIAEYEGRAPLTRAARIVAKQYGCTQSVARFVLEQLHDGEWHHVGKFAKECRYYDTTDWRIGGFLHHIAECGGYKKYQLRREVVRNNRIAHWATCPGPRKDWATAPVRSSYLATRLRSYLRQTR